MPKLTGVGEMSWVVGRSRSGQVRNRSQLKARGPAMFSLSRLRNNKCLSLQRSDTEAQLAVVSWSPMQEQTTTAIGFPPLKSLTTAQEKKLQHILAKPTLNIVELRQLEPVMSRNSFLPPHTLSGLRSRIDSRTFTEPF